MRALLLLGWLFVQSASAQDWLIASGTSRAEAGGRFEIVVIAPPGQSLPDELVATVTVDIAQVDVTLKAAAPAQNGRRAYAGTMPAFASGPVMLQLAGRASNPLLLVASRSDAVDALAGTFGTGVEPPLSENEPMYFIIGARGGATARFQISLKYRLFYATSGFGQDQPWLSGLYFGYTQNSLWDLSTESKAFRDTSYRPSAFWKWERAPGAKAFFDGARLGLEHESNGEEGERSRSINVAFVRPEWHWRLPGGSVLQFTPKLYTYLDKEENTDIDDYRGYADWRVRFDSGDRWIATAVLRWGNAGKGSVLVDLSRRTRDIRFGPVSGYLHVQFFAGYGEDIVDYNVRRKSQLRFGFAIVP